MVLPYHPVLDRCGLGKDLLEFSADPVFKQALRDAFGQECDWALRVSWSRARANVADAIRSAAVRVFTKWLEDGVGRWQAHIHTPAVFLARAGEVA